MTRIAEEVLRDLDKDTVNFVPNYDDTMKEPSVLPTRVPTLLLNGSEGIAVGMATKIPPHNLGELLNAILHLVDNPEATADELMEFVHGPDFPTGGTILVDVELLMLIILDEDVLELGLNIILKQEVKRDYCN